MKIINLPESLHDQILAYSGKDLPIGTGSGLSIDDPVMMLAHENYGHTQCEIFWFYLKDYIKVAWDVIAQEIVVIGDKHIDCFELSVSERPEDMKDEWAEKYYFDVADYV